MHLGAKSENPNAKGGRHGLWIFKISLRQQWGAITPDSNNNMHALLHLVPSTISTTAPQENLRMLRSQLGGRCWHSGIPQRSQLHVNTVSTVGLWLLLQQKGTIKSRLRKEGRMYTFTEPSTQDGLCLQEKDATRASCQAPILRGGLHLTAGTLRAASMELQRESISEIASPLN